MFLGASFFADADYLSMTAIKESGINEVKISNAIFDELYVTSNDITRDAEIPSEWDVDAILKSDFNGSVSAGNSDIDLNNIDGVLIKHRVSGTFEWTDVFYKEVRTIDDLNFIFYDKLCRSNRDYDFALVPVTVDSESYTENSYNIQSIKCAFQGIHLFDANEDYILPFNTQINVNKRNTNVKIEPIESKYPYTWNISKQRYEYGSFTTSVLPTTKDCHIDESSAQVYRQNVLDFLCNGEVKILKHFDGRIWMVQIEEDPSESSGEYWNLKETSFNWYEVGDTNSTQDLSENGLTNVPEERW